LSESKSEGVRLDVWLDVACLFKTRSEAQKECKAGRIDVNRQPAKPHRLIRVGDEIEIGRPFGRKQRVRVVALAEQHVARAEARTLYEDLTPPPSPEEVEARRLARIFHASVVPPNAPDKRQRRALRKLRGKE
jgi:ribosome-associated heat shock protein Hsp15